jgi:hypothetical protein
MFEVTPLLDGSTLVEGTDSRGNTGSAVLYSPAWEAVVEARIQAAAIKEFDATVEAFFAPIVEAADKLTKVDENPWASVTIGEAIEGKTPQVIHLDSEGIILRVLEEGDSDNLRWVAGGTQLVVVK